MVPVGGLTFQGRETESHGSVSPVRTGAQGEEPQKLWGKKILHEPI